MVFKSIRNYFFILGLLSLPTLNYGMSLDDYKELYKNPRTNLTANNRVQPLNSSEDENKERANQSVQVASNPTYERPSSYWVKLMKAIINHNIEEVKNLLKNNNIDLNYSSQFSGSLLGLSLTLASTHLQGKTICANTYLQIIELLLERDVNINGKLWKFSSSLEWAMYSDMLKKSANRLLIIRLLLNYGAEISEEVLVEASKKANFGEIFELLAAHANFREQAEAMPSKELLVHAIKEDNPFVVKLLIKAGLKIDEADLAFAKETNKKAAGKVLLNHFLNQMATNSVLSHYNLPYELIEYIHNLAKA